MIAVMVNALIGLPLDFYFLWVAHSLLKLSIKNRDQDDKLVRAEGDMSQGQAR